MENNSVNELCHAMQDSVGSLDKVHEQLAVLQRLSEGRRRTERDSTLRTMAAAEQRHRKQYKRANDASSEVQRQLSLLDKCARAMGAQVAEERERLSAEHERLRRLQADTLKDAAQLRQKLDARHSRLVREQSAFDAGCARTLQQLEEQRQALRAEQAAFAEERAAYVVLCEKHDASQHSVTARAADEEARLSARHDARREELRSTS